MPDESLPTANPHDETGTTRDAETTGATDGAASEEQSREEEVAAQLGDFA